MNTLFKRVKKKKDFYTSIFSFAKSKLMNFRRKRLTERVRGREAKVDRLKKVLYDL